jgi:hypothetical protein
LSCFSAGTLASIRSTAVAIKALVSVADIAPP